jgi:hypothetical protein
MRGPALPVRTTPGRRSCTLTPARKFTCQDLGGSHEERRRGCTVPGGNALELANADVVQCRFTTRCGRTIPCEVWSAKATASSARGFRRTRPPPPHISQWWSMSGGCTHRSPDVRQHSSLSTFLRRLPPVSFRRPCARLRDRPRAFAMYDPT